jgi:hypothetical protein
MNQSPRAANRSARKSAIVLSLPNEVNEPDIGHLAARLTR